MDIRRQRQPGAPLGDLVELLSRKVVGQPSALQYIVPCVQMYLPDLSADEAALCDRQDFPVLRKPFLAQDVLSLIQTRLLHSSAVVADTPPPEGRETR